MSFKPRYKVGETVYLKEPYFPYCFERALYKYDSKNQFGKWSNKLFMPEKYARYFIEITGVRCEQLQDISDEDCMKEGIFLDFIETDYFHYYDDENRYYCSTCETLGRERLVMEVLKDRERFGFNSEYTEDELKDELNSYSSDSYTDEVKTCDICGKDLSVLKNGIDEEHFYCPQEAFSAIIDRINGKGTWDSNPFVFAYDFKLLNNK